MLSQNSISSMASQLQKWLWALSLTCVTWISFLNEENGLECWFSLLLSFQMCFAVHKYAERCSQSINHLEAGQERNCPFCFSPALCSPGIFVIHFSLGSFSESTRKQNWDLEYGTKKQVLGWLLPSEYNPNLNLLVTMRLSECWSVLRFSN